VSKVWQMVVGWFTAPSLKVQFLESLAEPTKPCPESMAQPETEPADDRVLDPFGRFCKIVKESEDVEG
jgi:hypothetical protein